MNAVNNWLRNWIHKAGRQVTQSAVIRRSFYASLVFHGALLFVAAVFVISHIFYNRESTFTGQPPPMRTYEPRKLEFKVKVSKQQRSSSRPSMAPRMVSTKVNANVALPEIKMDAKAVKTSFQPKFKAFGGTGLGNGLGSGYGLGGFGGGVAQFDFFGIRGRGDKIAILVDVSVSMVEDERGGPKGYERVRDRINKVMDALAEGAMFNVIVFADAASAYEKEMIVATDDNKTKAKQFLRGFNTQGNYGLTTGNIQASSAGLPAVGGTTRLDLALTAAFEQGADTILIISDGLPKVKKGVTPEMAKAHAAEVESWRQANQAALAAYDANLANAQPQQAVSERVWIPPQPARPPSNKGLKEGQAPDKGSPAIAGHWEVRTITPPHPPRPQPPQLDPGWWTLNDFLTHFKMLHEALYVKKGKKLPVVHAIGYGIDKDGSDFLKTLAETYKGRYRRVTRVD